MSLTEDYIDPRFNNEFHSPSEVFIRPSIAVSVKRSFTRMFSSNSENNSLQSYSRANSNP